MKESDGDVSKQFNKTGGGERGSGSTLLHLDIGVKQGFFVPFLSEWSLSAMTLDDMTQ